MSSLAYDVIPGITAIQALTARHRIPLQRCRRAGPDHHRPAIACARGCPGLAVVMLDGGVLVPACARPPTADLVGRLSRHPRRAADRGHRRRGRSERIVRGAGARPACGTAGSWTPTCCGLGRREQSAALGRQTGRRARTSPRSKRSPITSAATRGGADRWAVSMSRPCLGAQDLRSARSTALYGPARSPVPVSWGKYLGLDMRATCI